MWPSLWGCCTTGIQHKARIRKLRGCPQFTSVCLDGSTMLTMPACCRKLLDLAHPMSGIKLSNLQLDHLPSCKTPSVPAWFRFCSFCPSTTLRTCWKTIWQPWSILAAYHQLSRAGLLEDGEGWWDAVCFLAFLLQTWCACDDLWLNLALTTWFQSSIHIVSTWSWLPELLPLRLPQFCFDLIWFLNSFCQGQRLRSQTCWRRFGVEHTVCTHILYIYNIHMTYTS